MEILLETMKAFNSLCLESLSLKTFYRTDLTVSLIIFLSTPGIKAYNFETHESGHFNYFSCGAAVSEVEIDCLTGDHSVGGVEPVPQPVCFHPVI